MTYTFRIAGMRYKVCLLKNKAEVERVHTELHQSPCSVYAFFQPNGDESSKMVGTIYLPIKGIRLELIVHEAVHLAHEICMRKAISFHNHEEQVAYYTGKIVHAVMIKLWTNPLITEI